MTFSIPYSFVPGTKAKADEVNANFIAVLNKIEETNTTKVNADLSNLDDIGQSILNAKANVSDLETKANISDLETKANVSDLETKANTSDIDGNWVSIFKQFASNVSLQGSTSLVYDLSTYLPKDSNVYEIILSGRSVTTNTLGSYAPLLVKTDKLGENTYICSCKAKTSSNTNNASTITIPLGTNKKITVVRTTDYDGYFYLGLIGYRKVR